jgi:uncharacterized protein (DUF952 family)
MAEIYHMAPASAWPPAGDSYTADSLESEGFLHCTAGERNLIAVAGRYYTNQPGDWVVLVIDPSAVTAEIRWQVQPDAMAYPHIHGALNVSAVTEVLPFPRNSNGAFLPFR